MTPVDDLAARRQLPIRVAKAGHRVALDILNGIKTALGIGRLNGWLARRDAAENLALALELQKHPAIAEAGKKLEESARRILS